MVEMHITFLNLVVVVSAIWRLSSLLANEEGPFLMFQRMREEARRWTIVRPFFREMRFSMGLECEWCNSLWISAPFTAAWYFLGDVVVVLALPLTLSAGVILLKYVVNCLECLKDYLELLGAALKAAKPPVKE